MKIHVTKPAIAGGNLKAMSLGPSILINIACIHVSSGGLTFVMSGIPFTVVTSQLWLVVISRAFIAYLPSSHNCMGISSRCPKRGTATSGISSKSPWTGLRVIDILKTELWAAILQNQSSIGQSFCHCHGSLTY